MKTHFAPAIVLVALVCGGGSALAQAVPVASTDLATNISQLGDLDYATRTNASRLVRRAPAAVAQTALVAAVRESRDEYVRFRALVLLSGFADRDTDNFMRTLITDRNDRVREVAYRWLKQHPDPALRQTLLSTLETEQAEFVRPALIGALATLGSDPVVQRALLAEAGRGLDFFRSAVIEALGEARATWALTALADISLIEGPLQDDAVIALGRLGDPQALAGLVALPASPVDVAMASQAARCMLGDDCVARVAALTEAVTSRVARPETVRAGVAALSALATTSDVGLVALAALLPNAAIHDDVVIGFGGVALRNPARVLTWLDATPEAGRDVLVDALAEAFDRFEEDYPEEQFFAAARAAYWMAAEGSSSRTLIATLIDKLDF